MDEEWEDEDIEWGEVPPFSIPEPDGQRLVRIAESRKAAIKLWDEVQREIRRKDI